MKYMNYYIFKSAILFFLLSVVCSQISAQTTRQHEIKAGETLYSLSRTYGVSIEDIKKANPRMTDQILSGQKINIPIKSNQLQDHIIINSTDLVVSETNISQPISQITPSCKLTYEVKKKETIFSISQQFGLTVDQLREANPDVKNDKIKKGMLLCIPYTPEELEAMKPVVEEEEIIIKEPVPVNFAIIMPFGLNQEKKNREAITMIDFYEGIMLAVSELKQQGVSGKVYAYDEEQLDSVLLLPQMKNLNLIIGCKDIHNINKLKNFTEKNNINLVVPLSSSTTLVNNTRNVYQVNQKMGNDTYDRAYESFTSMHPYANYVFVNIEEQTDKIDNVVRMKNFLNNENINYFSTDFSDMDSVVYMLAEGKENIIIPSSSTKTAFDRLVKKIEELELDAFDIDFFGYADWQAFANKNMEAFKKYNCTFFTSFYLDPNARETFAFNQKFRSAFGRDQYNTYPRYGILGYDIANFFIKNMYVEGEDFTTNIENLTSESLQNPFHFTHKNTWSGFINNAMMFVKYNSDGTISVKQL